MKLSSDIQGMKNAYDAVVIGSGYGGSICAARLAEAGRSVCLLERGKEWETGTFPDEVDEVACELRNDDNPLGLYDYRRGDDVDVLVGNGLGGTSLINANVVIEADPDIFQRPRWPAGIRNAAASGALKAFQDRFIGMIHPTDQGPKDGWPAKVAAMSRSADKIGATFKHLRVAVNLQEFDGKPNHVGVVQHLCTQCGDCVTGCNVGAKNTLMMNYLPYARGKGAEIYTCVEARFILPAKGGWFVWFEDLAAPRGAGLRSVFASTVVLSAGSLGSTGILLRSAERGLGLSWRLGHHFSGNGDQLGFGYNNDVRTDVLGFGAHVDKRSQVKVGPTILSMVDFRAGRDVEKRFIIEEGAVPRAFVDALRGFGDALDALEGQDTDAGFRDKVGELGRAALDWAGYSLDGAANHSMVYLGMGHDGADGRLVLDEKGDVKVLWGQEPDRPIFQAMSDEMYRLVKGLGGTYVRNPRWSDLLGRNLITVHPLGGCPMGDDVESGVVNHLGEVFDPAGGPNAVHEGLFVADGAVLPDSVGVNPLFMISTLAERTAAHIVSRKDLEKRPAQVPAPPPIPSLPIGLQFTEEMEGFLTRDVTNASKPEEYRQAYARAKEAVRGKKADGYARFRLTMFVDDVERFLREKEHEARAEGFVDGPVGGVGRRVDRGRFNLFVQTGEPGTRKMIYLLRYLGTDGKAYCLDGFKVVRDDEGLDLWEDNTTLFTSIREGDENGPIVAQGVLRIGVPAFLRLLSTIKVRNSPGASASGRTLSRFGRFFLGTLWETYVAPKLGAA
ncbi:MAG TPA: GMC family oxidoreductase [Anaeromyxobacter sp.]